MVDPIASAFLGELERAGIRLQRDGERLHFRTVPGVSIQPYRVRIAALKPALLAAMDWHAEATRHDGFDRARADALYARLVALESGDGADLEDAA